MSADAHLDSCAITGAAQAGACHCGDDGLQKQRKPTQSPLQRMDFRAGNAVYHPCSWFMVKSSTAVKQRALLSDSALQGDAYRITGPAQVLPLSIKPPSQNKYWTTKHRNHLNT